MLMVQTTKNENDKMRKTLKSSTNKICRKLNKYASPDPSDKSIHEDKNSLLSFYSLVIPSTLNLVLDITFSKQYVLMEVN